MLYTEAAVLDHGLARMHGRILIGGGLYTPVREEGLIVGIEPTPLLLSLFAEPPPLERLFEVLVEFVLYHDMVHDTEPMTKICDQLLAMGMRKGESATLWKAVRRGLSVP